MACSFSHSGAAQRSSHQDDQGSRRDALKRWPWSQSSLEATYWNMVEETQELVEGLTKMMIKS